MEKSNSSFAPLRNAQGLGDVMEFLADDNMAAIVEALRSDKWGKMLFPLYIGHKNHVIRYEIACSSQASEAELQRLAKDGEMIVRQAAHQNLISRRRSVAPQATVPEKIQPKANSNPEELSKEFSDTDKKSDKKPKRKKDRKTKGKKHE